MLLRSAFQLASPAGRRARLSILIFHRVLSVPDELFPGEMHADRFDAVCRWLKRWFQVLPLDEAAQRLTQGQLPARAACITFDDGYADNHDVALPILQRHGLPACFFIATGFLDGGRMWNDTIIESVRRCRMDALDLGPLGLGHGVVELGSVAGRRQAIDLLLDQIKYRPMEERQALVGRLAQLAKVELPLDLMMTSGQVRVLHQNGMQIGAHTESHPILARTGDEDAWREIHTSRQTLEMLLQAPVALFAYPNGKPDQDYRASHAAMVRKAGFAAAVSTAPGVSTARSDLFQLPRFSPWDRSRLRYGARLLANMRSAGTLAR